MIPILSYDDAPAAIEFLEKAFGVERQLVIQRPDGTIGHSELRLGTGVICVATARPDRGWKSPRELGAINQLLYVPVEDVDGHCRRARDAGAEIVAEPADMNYGGREYRARDPEGHEWSFGTYTPTTDSMSHRGFNPARPAGV